MLIIKARIVVSLGWGGLGQKEPHRGTTDSSTVPNSWPGGVYMAFTVSSYITSPTYIFYACVSVWFSQKNVCLNKWKGKLMRKLKLSHIKWFAQGHPAGEWQSRDLNQGSLALNIQTAPSPEKSIINSKATEMNPALPWPGYVRF